MPIQRRSPQLGALSLAVGLLIVSACGGGGEASKPTTVTIEATGKGKDVEVKAPESVKGGLVEMDFKNGSDQPRDGQIIRVEGDHSPQELLKQINSQGAPIPGWLQDGGGVGATEPGKTSSATQNLAEGRYIVVVAPEGEGEPATAEIQVEGGQEGELPKTSSEIVAREYSFDVKGLKPGMNEVLFKNEGQELHHVVGAPLRPGKSLDDVKKFVSEEGGGPPSGPPPIDENGGFTTAVIDGGVEQVTDIELKKPGKYALICFIQDRKGGPPHVMKGMIEEVEVQ